MEQTTLDRICELCQNILTTVDKGNNALFIYRLKTDYLLTSLLHPSGRDTSAYGLQIVTVNNLARYIHYLTNVKDTFDFITMLENIFNKLKDGKKICLKRNEFCAKRVSDSVFNDTFGKMNQILLNGCTVLNMWPKQYIKNFDKCTNPISDTALIIYHPSESKTYLVLEKYFETQNKRKYKTQETWCQAETQKWSWVANIRSEPKIDSVFCTNILKKLKY